MVENTKNERFVFVDAMRGIAAVAVVLVHLTTTGIMAGPLRRILPFPVEVAAQYGAYGVQILFVLSGFVIAHSVRNLSYSVLDVRNFILRRQLRLDPPYWTVLVLTLLEHCILNWVPFLKHMPLPTWQTIGENLVYLQGVIQAKPIVGVSWTLCIEVQFYIIFIAILAIGMAARQRKRVSGISAQTVGLVISLGLISLVTAGPSHALRRWFIYHWHYFASGALGYWAVRGQIRTSLAAAFLYIDTASAILRQDPALIVGAMTAITLFLVGRTNHLTDWLDFRILQYLGRISYSLYLIHVLVAFNILTIGYKITGENPIAALGWYVLAVLASITGAHVLWRFIERPSILISSSLKTGKVPDTQ